MLIEGDGTPHIPPPDLPGPNDPAFEQAVARAQADAAGNASDINAQTVIGARSQAGGETLDQKIAEIHPGNAENEPDSPTANEGIAGASVARGTADINAELRRLFGNGKNGAYTAAEISQAAAALAAHAALLEFIDGHFTEAEFTELYFAGMYNPEHIEFNFDPDKSSLSFGGFLQDPATGARIGGIDCTIYPERGCATLTSLRMYGNGHGVDFVKRLIGNQIEVYRTLGLTHVDLTAHMVGSYALAKYGWLPTAESWKSLRTAIEARTKDLARPGGCLYGQISDADSLAILAMLRSDDPQVVWDIAGLDMLTGVNNERGRPMTLGMALLIDQYWTGTLDLGNPGQMKKFHDYIAPPVSLSTDDGPVSALWLDSDPPQSAADLQAGSQYYNTRAMGATTAGSGLPRLGGDEVAQAAFEKYIGPYCSEDEFVDTYLAGMHNPSIEFYFDSGILTISIVGFLQDPATGDNVGEIIRLIDVGNRRAAHLSLELHDNVQGADLGKRLIGNQIEIYQKIGIKHVDLSPNNVGGYAWAKYGWLPIDADTWIALRNDIEVRVYALRNGEGSYGRISYADSLAILEMLRSDDPKVVWDIADLEMPTGVNDGRGKPMTLGKALLLDQSWTGTLDLGNPDQMRRFDDYVSKKPDARQ